MMYLKYVKRCLVLSILFIAVIMAMCIQTFAHSPVADVTVDVSGGKSNTMASDGTGTITVIAQGTDPFLWWDGEPQTATVTITNDKAEEATVSFEWTATNVNQLTIDGTKYTGDSGMFSKKLNAGGSFSVVITTAANSTENKLVMTSFVSVSTATNFDVTVEYSALGSVKVGGDTVATGGTVSVSAAGAEIAASVTAEGAKFVAWYDKTTGNVLSTNAKHTLQPTANMTIVAVFESPTTPAMFLAGKTLFTNDLTAAITHVTSSTDKTIIAISSGTVLKGSYTLPSGAVLLIPRSNDGKTDDLTVYTSSTGNAGEYTYTTPKIYRTLTLEAGTDITVKGSISIAGYQGSTQEQSGAPSGYIGMIKMSEGSSITVEANGTLYAWGLIVGSGEVYVKSSAAVYENFQIRDWRGGTAAYSMTNKGLGADNVDTYHVFPFSQYYIQNIQVPMTLESGANEYGAVTISASLVGAVSTNVHIIGTDDGLFRITSGYLVKDYDEKNDRLVIDIHGEILLSSMDVSLSSYKMNSADYVLPITNNMTININGESKVTTGQDMAMLPGVQMNISPGASFTVGQGKNLFVYDLDEWTGYCGTYNSKYIAIAYAYEKGTRAALEDVKIVVNGTLDASTGYLYTTTGGANICSTANGQVKITAGTQTITYQASQNNTSITYPEIAIVPGYLQNEDGTALETETATYNYDHHDCCGPDALHGVWYAGEHNYTTTNDGKCTCTHDAAVMVVPKDSGTAAYYDFLADACEDFDSANHLYIQMLANSVEADISKEKTIYLDLNGKNITLNGPQKTLILTNLYVIDSATNALGASGSSYGTITGTVSANLDKVYQCDFGPHAKKTYVVVQDTTSSPNTLSVHRVRLGIDHYTYYINGETGALTFNAAFLGDSKAMGAMTDLGMNVNNDTATYWVGGKTGTGVSSYTPASYEQTTDYGYGYDATKYVPTGYSLELTFTDLTASDSFDVSALLKVNGETLDSSEHTGHNASGVSITDYITTTTGE